jgi:hypothetical protein
MFGYTPKQAEQLKHHIDTQIAKIEDAAYRMRVIVSDHAVTTDNEVEALRERAHELKEIVDGRTRR